MIFIKHWHYKDKFDADHYWSQLNASQHDETSLFISEINTSVIAFLCDGFYLCHTLQGNKWQFPAKIDWQEDSKIQFAYKMLFHWSNAHVTSPNTAKTVKCLMQLLACRAFFSFCIYHSYSFLLREHMNSQLTYSQRQWLHCSVGTASHR